MRVLLLLAAGAALSGQTVQEAKAFLDAAEADLLKQSNYLNRASWLQSTSVVSGYRETAARKVIGMSRLQVVLPFSI